MVNIVLAEWMNENAKWEKGARRAEKGREETKEERIRQEGKWASV